MAVEAKRGCGYRKVGGLYLVADGGGSPCCKMPLELSICPCCGNGVKQARGWTWIDAGKMFPAGGCSAEPLMKMTCPAVNPALLGKVGLLWIGEKFYPRPIDFLTEAAKLGTSRRMHRMPRGFKGDVTWVLFAHPKAIEKPRTIRPLNGVIADVNAEWVIIDPRTSEIEKDTATFAKHEEATAAAAALDLSDPIFVPGVIRIVKPRGFELIVKQSDFDRAVAANNDDLPDLSDADVTRAKALGAAKKKDEERGVTWIPVPDNDPDHQGTVYDNEKEEVA